MSRKKNGESKQEQIPVFKPLTKGQKEYAESIDKNAITICIGPAGAGKSFVAAAKAIEYLRNNKVEKIIVIRAAVECSLEKMGAFPGDLQEKYEIYTIPIIEEIQKLATPSEIRTWQSHDKIEYTPVSFVGGRTFNNSFIILEEAGSCILEQLILVLTRLGQNSKMVISGDLNQSYISPHLRGGLLKIYEKLTNIDDIGLITLQREDIVRNDLISKILERLL